MKRREFFKLGADKTARVAMQAADRVAGRAKKWFRPPFALDELPFLLACTKCDKCVHACPHDVLFTLPSRFGVRIEGTPAMDLLGRGCHLCSDWPCVAACEPGALKLPDEEPDEKLNPRFAQVTINTKTCLPYAGPECGACKDSCPVPGALEWQDGLRPAVNQEVCTGCALCREACIVDPKAIEIAVLTF